MEQIFQKQNNPLFQLNDEIKNPGHHYILALMFNRATDVITELVNYNESNPYLWEKIRNIALTAFDPQSTEILTFKPSTYMALVEYMWGGMNKGDLKTALSDHDKQIVAESIFLLNGFRNYASHYYHEIDVLLVSDRMRDFLENLKREAIEKVREVYIKKGWYKHQVEQLESFHFEIFEEIKNAKDRSNFYINLNGLIFFSSLFLPASDMSLLFRKVETFKRDDKPEYSFKCDVYRYFAKRDGSSRLGFLYVKDLKGKVKDAVEKEDAIGKELKGQFMLTAMNDMLEVLKRKPEHMIEAGFLEKEPLTDDSSAETENDEDEEQKFELTRKGSPFLRYAVRYFMDFKNELGWHDVKWRTLKRYRDGYTTSEKNVKRKIKDREVDVRIDLMEKKLFEYVNDYTPLNKIYINDQQVYAQLRIGEKDVSIVLHERAVKNIVASFAHSFPDWKISGSRSEAMLKAIYTYADDYNRLLDDLENHKAIAKSNYPSLNFKHLPEKLQLLSGQKTFADSVEQVYKKRIETRIKTILSELEKLTPETIDAYFGPSVKNKKNKLLQRWYNNMLNTEHKLKVSKGRQSSKSELDKLSIFHFTLDNRKQPLYSLVEKLANHLPVFLRPVFTESKHGDYWDDIGLPSENSSGTPRFDHLFFKIKNITHQYWSQLLESLEKNTLPENWQNYGEWEMEEEILVLGKPVVCNREWLEALARKLDINNPDIENNREIKGVEKGMELPRRQQLIKDFKSQSVFIPASYISNLLINDREFDARIADGVVEYEGSEIKKIHFRQTVSGQIRNDKKLCNPLIPEFYLQENDREKLKKFAGDDGKLSREGQYFLQETLQLKTLDALLLYIANQYYKKFHTGGELTHLSDFKSKGIPITLNRKCTVEAPYSKVRQLSFNSEKKKWEKLALLYFPLAKKIAYTELEQYIKENRTNAGYLIEKILELERKNNRLIKEEADKLSWDKTWIEGTPYRHDYKHLGFKKIAELINLGSLNKEKVIKWRNAALHGDVPEAKYGDLKKAKEELQKLLPEKKGRGGNKKDRYSRN